MKFLPVSCGVVLCCTCALSASAQTTSAVNAGIQFDFSLPGAKSLAMGGAFVALANDATAAQANPAGLTHLYVKKPQLSVEGRGWNFFSLTPDQGHAFGEPTGVGFDAVLTAGRWPRAGAELAGVTGRELQDTTKSMSLITFLYAKPDLKWVVAGYRHQLLHLVNRTETNGPFLTLPSGDVTRINPVTGRIEADIATYGATVARSFRRLSVGGGTGFSTFSINSRAQSFDVAPHQRAPLAPGDRASYTGVGGQFGPADFSEHNVAFIDEQMGEDTAWSYNIGASVELGESNQWKIGGAFRRGPTFRYDTRFFLGPALSSGTLSQRQLDEHTNVPFKVPDSYAVGLAATPGKTVTLTFEYTYVQYKQLIDGSGTGLPIETAGQSRSPDPVVRAEGLLEVQALEIDNAHQLRAGVEWAVLQSGAVKPDGTYPRTVFLRGGGWYDPDHRLHTNITDPNNARLVTNSVLLPRGSDEGHVSFGTGIVLGGRVQIDAGIDLSPRVNTVALSTVVYF
jgi:long-chain fatty acid transport protein